MRYRLMVLGAAVILYGSTAVPAAEVDEVDREIARLKKEISRVQSQRQDEAKEVKKEQAEFESYRERTAARMASVTRQTDSIRTLLQRTNLHNDSINAALAAVTSQIREQDLQRERLREVILRASKMLQGEMDRFTPLIREQYAGPIGYLIGEIEVGSVENTEALYRLLRIIWDLRTVCREIQVVEVASPVPQMRGTVYRLRIGSVFEAIVDMQGEKAFLWNTAEDGTGRWIALPRREDAASILAAVRIREGKTVPELIHLPFGTDSVQGEGGSHDQ
ncbi:MAG: DUF3450 family protein [Chitinispirillaceae bacterium]|nr:DUF3450 family protein [Chitinispirillaceae bacterium]